MGQHAIGLSFRNSGFFDRVDQSAVRAHSLLVIGAKASSLQGYSTKFGMSVETIGVRLTYSRRQKVTVPKPSQWATHWHVKGTG